MRNLTRRVVSLHLVSLAGLLASACGPGYLTPEEVRSHLLLPRGTVAQETVGRATDDFFDVKGAQSAEGFARLLKSSESGGDSASAWAAGLVDSGDIDAMERAVSFGAAETIGDIFCAAGLVAAISAFDDCEGDQRECEVDLTIDSCILRIGEGGDENARGKISFRLRTVNGDDWHREELNIEFEGFEVSSSDDTVDYLGGLIALESTEIGSGHLEVIFSADIDAQQRSVERGLFDDGILSRERFSVALRFTAQASDEASSGTLEIVAFVDVDDDAHDQSVVLTLQAESRQIDDETNLAGASLIVRGSNGYFTCTWEAASTTREGGTSTYDSSGGCIDEETGEEFTFAANYEITEDV
ncbi:MAG: hypothetical protein ACO3JL_01690 [Myxococcota bacterium]